jgi:CRP-like cAMP-binding protein
MECLKSGQDRVTGTIAKLRAELHGKFISRVPLLMTEALTDMDRYWLVGKLRPFHFKAGDEIVRQGDIGDRMYIIEIGTCDVFADGRWIRTMGREDFFGELAVMNASPRSASVYAKEEVTLLSLSRDDLHSTLTDQKIENLAIVARARLFGSIPLLAALSPAKKESVTERLKLERWPPGAVLALQGRMLDAERRKMHIILEGKCLRETKGNNVVWSTEKVVVEEIGHGAHFNMFSMWYVCPCFASVKTVTETTTLSISYDDLIEICNSERRHLQSEQSRLSLTGRSTQRPSITKLPLCESQTLLSIRRAMWILLLKMMFMRFNMHSIAFNDNALALVCGQCTQKTFKPWDIVFTKGVPYDVVYVLETGELSEHSGDIETLRDSHELGENGRLHGCIQHTATGTCFGADCSQGKGKCTPTSTLAASQETLMLSIRGDILRRMLRNGSLEP